MATDFTVNLVNVSGWYDDHNLFRQLKVLYHDLITVANIDKAKKTIDLLHQLMTSGYLSSDKPSLLYETIKVTQTFEVMKVVQQSFFEDQEIKITTFTPYRHWILDFGNGLTQADVENIDALYNGTALKKYQDAWSMILDFEHRQILCEDKIEEFITSLNKIGLHSKVECLTKEEGPRSMQTEKVPRSMQTEEGTADDNTPAEIRCRAIKRFVVDEDVEQQDTSACKSWIDEHVFIIIGAVMLILVVVAVSVTLGLLSIESNSTESTTMAIGTTTHEASAVSEFDTSNTNGLALRSTTITHTSTTESTANAKTTPISTTIIQNSPTTELTNEWLMGDCGNILQFYPVSGEYVIQPSDGGPQINVYCDIREDGNWTVIQRRQDGSVDFYRNWTEYKEGFGNVNTEFWLGNEQINRLTANGNFELMVEMTDHLNVTKFAKYSQFHVGTEDSNYVLTISGYTGTVGDSLAWYHNGEQFTTKDRNNDRNSGNCAELYKGAWWYKSCYDWYGLSNLNGLYLTPGTDDNRGIIWWHFHNNKNSLKKTVMMVKRAP
ncbi:uncharacterized protein [Antedon mediterranea]|uniref:uncharacterized protein isoform X2 n=1 Tax=Antedon mediterranea TaxID=105859 RepID=UPI003AF434F1